MSSEPTNQVPEPRTSRKAIIGLVLGILSWVPCLPILPAIPGIILSLLGLTEANKNPGAIKGQGLAIGGIVVSGLGLVLGVVYIVIGVVFVLPIVLFAGLTSVGGVRQAANRTQSQNNLKQMALAVHMYSDKHNQLPGSITNATGQPLLSWRVGLLPFLEQDLLYQRFDRNQPWDSPPNQMLLSPRPEVFRDPIIQPPRGQQPAGRIRQDDATHYRTFVGPGTVFSDTGTPRFALFNMPDGTSNTILAVEASDGVPWTKQDELRYQPGQTLSRLGPPGQNSFLAAMWDGSVRVVRKSVSEETLRRAIDPADGQVLGADW